MGGSWGLASSGIHFLDLLAYLAGVSVPGSWNTDWLDDRLHESKRADYYEIGGRASFSLQGGHEVVLKDDKTSRAPLVIDIMGKRSK